MIGRLKNVVEMGKQCSHCGRFVARDIVCSAILVKGNKVLLVKRGIEPEIGKWALPGGYLSWNETVEEAIIREVKEETGYDIKIRNFLGIYSDPNRIPGENLQNVGLMFVCELISEENSGHDNETLDLKWFDLKKIPQRLAFDHNEVLERFRRLPFLS